MFDDLSERPLMSQLAGTKHTYVREKNRVFDLSNNCQTYKTVNTTDVPEIL